MYSIHFTSLGSEYFPLKHYVHTFVELGQPNLHAGECKRNFNHKKKSSSYQWSSLLTIRNCQKRLIQKLQELQIKNNIRLLALLASLAPLAPALFDTGQHRFPTATSPLINVAPPMAWPPMAWPPMAWPPTARPRSTKQKRGRPPTNGSSKKAKKH